MKIEQAKEQLKKFLGGRTLTFSIRWYDNNEWVAECNEIPAIMTGGKGDDIAYMDTMMREAILTAAGIDTEYAAEILKFVRLNPMPMHASVLGLNRPSASVNRDRQAEYVLS